MNKLSYRFILCSAVLFFLAWSLWLLPSTHTRALDIQATTTPNAYAYLPYLVNQPPSPTPSATPSGNSPLPGQWTGITNSHHPMSFEVINNGNQWRNFSLELSGQVGACQITITTTVPGPGSINNNLFSWNGTTFDFTGIFDSATTASGTYALTNYYVFGCGYLNQAGSWVAHLP